MLQRVLSPSSFTTRCFTNLVRSERSLPSLNGYRRQLQDQSVTSAVLPSLRLFSEGSWKKNDENDDDDDFHRSNSNSNNNDNDRTIPWRKRQLQKLEERFEFQAWPEYEIQNIKNDEELQPTWKDMERRVTRRPTPLSKEQLEARGKMVGRSNVKKTEEEEWLKAGAYYDLSDAGSGKP